MLAPSVTHSRPPRLRDRGMGALLALGLLATLLLSAPTVQAGGGNGLRDAANGYRLQAGLNPVVGTALLDDIATRRADDMAAQDELEHDMAYVRNRFAAADLCWSRFGEIIAWSPGDREYSFAHTLDQWWNSDVHRTIFMGASHQAAGGAWDGAEGGGNYSVMIFVTLCGNDVPTQAYGQTPFTDVASSPFRQDIEWLYLNEITTGCTASTFCPAAGVTRAQMASFLDRQLELPDASRDWFTDDDGLVHEGAINRVAEAGITSGCGDGRFCPNGGVTREQMASFLVRAKGLSAGAGTDLFDDDDRSRHELDIDRLAYGGITSGCAVRRYCPSGGVTREQMAAFLRRAFGS